MTTKNGTRTAIRQALLAAATGAGALLVPAAPAAAADGCPPGQIEDAQTPGFQCVLCDRAGPAAAPASLTRSRLIGIPLQRRPVDFIHS